MLPAVVPMPLDVRRAPFDDPQWLFEVKVDGYRAVAYVDADVRLVSRTGRDLARQRRFSDVARATADVFRGRQVILDGELACFFPDGRSDWRGLQRRSALPYFAAFDVLWLDGEDLRERPLRERKALLRDLVPEPPCRVLYVEAVPERGVALFNAVRAADMEGIVAKWADGPYRLLDGLTSWVKIKNRAYSQMADRFG